MDALKKYMAISLPILLLTIYVYWPTWFIIYSNTVLGKILLIAAIIMYTSIDFLYGVLSCLLVILYYQSDKFENIIAIESMSSITKPESCKYAKKMPKPAVEEPIEEPVSEVQELGQELGPELGALNEPKINVYNHLVCAHGIDLTKHYCDTCNPESEIIIFDDKLKDEDFLRMSQINCRR